MSMIHVTTPMAFACSHTEFTDGILFEEDQSVLKTTPKEQDTIGHVLAHLEECWVDLLFACRDALWSKIAESLPATRKNQTTRKTAWKQFFVQIPLVLQSTNTTASVSISIEIRETDSGPQYVLAWSYWAQPRNYGPQIDRLAAEWNCTKNDSSVWFSNEFFVLRDGDSFSDLAGKVAARIDSNAIALAKQLTGTLAPETIEQSIAAEPSGDRQQAAVASGTASASTPASGV